MLFFFFSFIQFGVVAVEPYHNILIDGDTKDWDKMPHKLGTSNNQFSVSISHNEEFVYFLVEKNDKSSSWNFQTVDGENGGNVAGDELYIPVDVADGGSASVKLFSSIEPGSSGEPIRTIPNLSINADLVIHISNRSTVYINQDYDIGFLFGYTSTQIKDKGSFRGVPSANQGKLGNYRPYSLILSTPLTNPETGESFPIEYTPLGDLNYGISDPSRSEYSERVHWFTKDNVLELRLPWMMLGFMDPSSKKVQYSYQFSLQRSNPLFIAFL